MIDLQAINHTNRELELMLEGSKPLAVFYDEISVLPHEEIIPEERFHPYVVSGLFVRGEGEFTAGFHAGLGREAIIKYVLFARKEEAWRIPAYLLMRKVLYKFGYSEALERIENGTFGICESCAEEISVKRLKARPVTTQCIECKAKEEALEKALGI